MGHNGAMDIDVKGKRVVVAGASRGIGRSIALAFAQAGASVSVCARGPDALEATRRELAAFGGIVHAATCDLSKESDIARYIPEAAAAMGGIGSVLRIVPNLRGTGGKGRPPPEGSTCLHLPGFISFLMTDLTWTAPVKRRGGSRCRRRCASGRHPRGARRS